MRTVVAIGAGVLAIAMPLACLGKTHDRWPAFSPDGRSVAFERFQDGRSDIYVAGIDGRNLRRVTDEPAPVLAIAPAWFPSGEQMLFTTTDATSDYPSGSFVRIPSAGGAARVLAPAGERGRSLSPDGSKLLYLTRPPWKVASLNLATGASTILTPPDVRRWDSDAAWSPDGKRIAFGCDYMPGERPERGSICVMNADGSGRRVVSARPGVDEWPTWSPDGKRIAFQCDSDGYTKGSIVVADAGGGNEADISAATGYALNETPDWSPDGKWIAFQVKTASGYRIAVMKPDGSEAHLLLSP